MFAANLSIKSVLGWRMRASLHLAMLRSRGSCLTLDGLRSSSCVAGEIIAVIISSVLSTSSSVTWSHRCCCARVAGGASIIICALHHPPHRTIHQSSHRNCRLDRPSYCRHQLNLTEAVQCLSTQYNKLKLNIQNQTKKVVSKNKRAAYLASFEGCS